MKKIFLFFIFFIFSFSFEIDYSNNTLIKSSLKNRFETYWLYRANRKFNLCYSYEMPYLRYLYSKNWYLNYFFYSRKIKRIKVLKINCKNKNICYISMLLYYGSKNPVFFKDKWVKVDGVWYHRFYDRVLPFN